MTEQARRTHPSQARAHTALNFELLRRQNASSASRRPHALPAVQDDQDFFMERGGVRCAGVHLIVDLYDARRLDEIDFIERTLRRCVDAAGATLLHLHLHTFEPNGGVSGVAVLAESHMSIHSWPERGYAALDIFMCGSARPKRCIEVLLDAFAPGRIAVEEILRGRSA